MTVNVGTCKNTYTGSGSTGPFTFSFPVYEATDLLVTVTTTGNVTSTLVLNVDYTVDGLPASGAGTGTITLTSALHNNYTLTIVRNMPYLQGQDWSSGDISSDSLNDVADKAVMQIQQVLLAANSGVPGVQGQQGPVGPAGPAGPAGPTGPAGPGYAGTSTSSLTIGTGVQTVTTQALLAYRPGSRVRIAYQTSPASQFMEGVVTNYAGVTMTVGIDTIVGSGTYAAWNIGIAGIVGATGTTGATGATGATGPQGSPGVNWQGTWGALTAYTVGMGVSYGGCGWVCVSANTGQVPGAGAYWCPIVFSSNRCRLINKEMRIDQKNAGASQSSSTGAYTYCVDQWWMYASGAAVTGQRVANTGAASQFQYCYQINGAASNTLVQFGQRIESINVADLGNGLGQVTFSVYLNNGGTTPPTSITWTAQYPGSLDNWTSPVTITNGTFSITATQTQYTATFTLPSNCVNGLQIILSVANFTTGDIQITGAQLEPGTMASPFERRPDDVELGRCFRYQPPVYRVNDSIIPIGNGQVFSSSAASFFVPFPVPTRIAPTGFYVTSNGNLYMTSANGSSALPSTVAVIGNGSFCSQTMGLLYVSALSSGTIVAGNASTISLGSPGSAIFYFTGCQL